MDIGDDISDDGGDGDGDCYKKHDQSTHPRCYLYYSQTYLPPHPNVSRDVIVIFQVCQSHSNAKSICRAEKGRMSNLAFLFNWEFRKNGGYGMIACVGGRSIGKVTNGRFDRARREA